MKQLLVIESLQPSEMDRAIVRLAEWMGVERTIVANSSHPGFLEELTIAARNGDTSVAVRADTLAKIPDLSAIVRAISEFGVEAAVPILLYGIDRTSSHIALLEGLGCQCIRGVHQIQKQPLRYRFSANEKACLQQLAGLDFSNESSVACDVFELVYSVEHEVAPLLLAEDQPVLIRTKTGQGNIELYLWATNQIADVGAPASRDTRPEDMYQWLLPAIIYLKTCFGSSCWHNPNVRARLIIDDPLLQPQYGFLRYDELLESMQRVPYGTSLAFIPWNYRRSRKQVSELFRASKDRLSLCIHGCDHTNHEFDSDEEQHLAQLASLALQRMKRHQECSGLSHEKIMVFPQGRFSSHALRALRVNGFVAAVNSSCYPSREEVELTLGDLLRPAVCRFHGFPIFLRRGPDRVIDIAVDLFLGKAGFVVAHHELVRDGYGAWEQFVEQMNALDERLSWNTLMETITETCLQRVADHESLDIRLFTPIFKWRNQLEYPVRVRLSKFEPDSKLIKEVRVNGHAQPFSVVEGYLCFEVVVEGNGSIMVEILDQESYIGLPFEPPLSHQIGAGARRLLSEFRDDTLSRHPTLLEKAKNIARSLRLTGDSR